MVFIIALLTVLSLAATNVLMENERKASRTLNVLDYYIWSPDDEYGGMFGPSVMDVN